MRHKGFLSFHRGFFFSVAPIDFLNVKICRKLARLVTLDSDRLLVLGFSVHTEMGAALPRVFQSCNSYGMAVQSAEHYASLERAEVDLLLSRGGVRIRNTSAPRLV
jgi:hypothetical protein